VIFQNLRLKAKSLLGKIFHKASQGRNIPDGWDMAYITSAWKKGHEMIIKIVKI
jgi:hypothetical protein